jgi:violaxanthin de-epoxidase
MKLNCLIVEAAALSLIVGSASAWVNVPATSRHSPPRRISLGARRGPDEDGTKDTSPLASIMKTLQTSLASTAVAASLALGAWTQAPAISHATASAADPSKIVGCLLQKCPGPLAQCIANPKCLANVICINTCNGRPDEVECQIDCGTLWENDVVGVFNKCAVSDMSCVPQQPDDGSYPVPKEEQVVPKFDTKLFNGRWYISAGQNKLFDIFPCQVHFFEETSPGNFFGKLNWRVEEPDGEFFTRDALQSFSQDPKQPGHLINHDNEYLHYQDDWWIIDYAEDDNKDGVPPFAFVYYRGSNDAWDGYGGVVVYTRAAALPQELLPRLRVAAEKVGFNWDRDFELTDNTCQTDQSPQEKIILREKFAGKVILKTENQLQAEATRLRGNTINSIKAQKLFFEKKSDDAQGAFQRLNEKQAEFENETVQKAQQNQ